MFIIYNFVFLYPLIMAFVWMLGSIIFRFFRQGGPDEIPYLDRTPLVSILVPCHNEERCIGETIEYLMEQVYPDFEVIAINDASRDGTGRVLHQLQQKYDRLRIVSLKSNRGKGTALTMGALVSRGEYLVCIDADALLDIYAVRRIVWHFINFPNVGAVTGNPRIRNRTSILGKIQVGELSSIVGMIKRTQRILGKVYTVSGVVAAFRKKALLSIGFWSNNMVTEDIDISWKLQVGYWDIRYEPRALCWILVPETLKGLFNQRVRWCQGGAEVLLKYCRLVSRPGQRRMWAIFLESAAGVVWAYCFFLVFLLWLLHFVIDLPPAFLVERPFPPGWTGSLLVITAFFQFNVGLVLDARFEKQPYSSIFWMVWYPFLYWIINAIASVIGLPRALFKKKEALAVWEHPDRGF